MHLYRFAAAELVSALPLPVCEPFRTEGLSGVMPVMELGVSEAPFSVPESAPCVKHTEMNVYSLPDGWLYADPEGDQLRLSRDYRTLTYHAGDAASDQTPLLLLRSAIECLSIGQGMLSLHSACVDTGEEALCFTGRSGLGKSTRAAALAKALGTDLISGDRPQVMLGTGGMIACGAPWDGKEQLYRNVQKPLRAILEVRRSEGIRLRYLNEKQKLALLMRQCFIPMWDPRVASLAILAVRRLAAQREIIRCFCGPEPGDVLAAYRILREEPDRVLPPENDLSLAPGWTLRDQGEEPYLEQDRDPGADHGTRIRLNELSALVCRMLSQGIAREDILYEILSQYEADPDTVSADLEGLLAILRSFGVLGQSV